MLYKVSTKAMAQSNQASKRNQQPCANTASSTQNMTSASRYTQRKLADVASQGVVNKAARVVYKKKAPCAPVSSTQESQGALRAKLDTEITVDKSVPKTSPNNSNITFSNTPKGITLKDKIRNKIFIQNMENLKTCADEDNQSNKSSPLRNSSRIRDNEQIHDSIQDSEQISLFNLKNGDNGDNSQKFKSCVVMQHFEMPADKAQFQNQDTLSDGGNKVSYLQIAASTSSEMKKGAQARKDSFSATTASQDEEHSINQGLTDHENSDIDVCSVDMSDIPNKAHQQQLFSTPQGSMVELPKPLQLKMSLEAPSFQPGPTLSIPKPQQKQKLAQTAGPQAASMESSLESLSLNSNFTPSTPYVHKFRTEMCKNYELYGKCKYGDECSFAHQKCHMMIKTDVSALYKTKLCKKFSANGYCPYGMRCQFIHQVSETQAGDKPDEVNEKALSTAFENILEETSASEKKTASTSSASSANKVESESKMAGGFGNMPASHGLKMPKIIYLNTLVHCVHVSVQEYQKKMKMFQKKVYKKRLTNTIVQPEIQYMNIYQGPVKRLSCFSEITSDSNTQKNADMSSDRAAIQTAPRKDGEDRAPSGYFHGDAQQYEKHLDHVLKLLNQGVVPNSSLIAQNNQYASSDETFYETDDQYYFGNTESQMMESTYLSDNNYSQYSDTNNNRKILKLGQSFKPFEQEQQKQLRLNIVAPFVPKQQAKTINSEQQSFSLFQTMLPSFEALVEDKQQSNIYYSEDQI